MKKYFKPMVNVISVMSLDSVAAAFNDFDGFGSFASTNIESYTANSAALGNHIVK